MQRITMTIDDDLLAALDHLIQRSGATNRSEALRDLLRRALNHQTAADHCCIGIVSYAVDPAQRNLGQRLPQMRQERHDKTVAALSVPLDHDSSIEVAILRGRVDEVEDYANGLFLERGVRHGALALVPVQEHVETHHHGGKPHAHRHLKVKTSFA